ncbi:hypothetical protein J2S43_001141 [Catenuloplanes nepalensis]|uniref:LamG-like jellyroll fold domain-containing protein n=1 Tax=Catenuloplanes nepalensis TaxID=587533 RepID=A0ABT9MMH6_9ACTN|nr:LamG domain-containing protein [Catenuloplanes nepalensis]MDP9792629.1 hypothetical protein [Catenuloplanes nepalensis]
MTKFRFGWSQTPLGEVTATTSGALKTATVKLTVPKYGLINMYAYAIDATLNNGALGSSADYLVPRPSPAVAKWGLETYPGTDETAALADQQTATAGDTPLTTMSTTWNDSNRLMNARTLTFNNTAAKAVAAGLKPDTTKSFSVTAWVRPNDLTGAQTIAATDAGTGQWSPFRLQLRTDNGPKWCMTMNTRIDNSTATSVCSPTVPVAGQWTHVAGSFDATDGKIRLWVNGAETNGTFLTPLTTSGALLLGRATNAGAAADQLRGSLADAQFFDRVLVIDDFTGQLASETDSAGLDEAGILTPLLIADWDFQAAEWCLQEGAYQSTDFSCQAPDATPFQRRLSLTTGVNIVEGHDGGNALHLDSTFTLDPGDPRYGSFTEERAYAQWNSAPTGQTETWTNSPVARTDQSFTVSAWLRPDVVTGRTRTALSVTGNVQSSFYLGIRSYTVNNAEQHRWAVSTQNADAVTGASGGVSAADNPIDPASAGTNWTHITAVFNAPTKTVSLYINGDLAGNGQWPGQWPAPGPLTLGAARYSDTTGATSGQWVDQWNGAIDDVRIYQGAATSSTVHQLFTNGS